MSFPARKVFVPLLVAALFGSLLTPVEAASVRRLQLDEIRDRSVSVFLGQVVDRTTRAGAEGKMAWTDYEISVAEHLSGTDPGVRTTVSFAGGTVGELSVGIAGVPRLEVGATYVFFLQDGSRRPTATLGWGQGLYRVERVDLGGTSRDLLVSYDGEPLQMTPDGRITRGPAVRVEGGSVWAASLRRDPKTARMGDPAFTAADGSAIPQPSRSVSEATPLLERNWATLDDLRSFLDGSVEAARGGSR